MKAVYQGFLVKKGSRIKVNHKKTSSILINRLHISLMEHFSQYFNGKLLDGGCGEKPYSLIYGPLVKESIGVDVEYCIHEQSSVDVFASLDDLPFEDESFDSVLCTSVLEHVQDSPKGFYEISRVLKKGGYAILSIPYLYPVHEAPHDYFRYTYFGFKSLVQRNGLEIVHMVPWGGILFFFTVYFNLFVNKIIKIPPLIKLSCIMQDIHYELYRKFIFPSLVSDKLKEGSINSIISLGYFVIARKK